MLRVLFYGNCQALALFRLWKKYFPLSFYYDYVCNYDLLKLNTNQYPPEFALADIVVFQPLQGHGFWDTQFLHKHVKPETLFISFAYLYFLGYFPDSIKDPQNDILTKNQETPFGLFPYGHSMIRSRLLQGKQVKLDSIWFSEGHIQGKLQYGLDTLREKEKETSVKMADFIASHFRSVRLFHSVNHPTNFLLFELANRIALLFPGNQLLQFPSSSSSSLGTEIKESKEELLDTWTGSIIYPSVRDALQLQFDTSTIRFKADQIVSLEEWIESYKKYLYPFVSLVDSFC